MARTNITRLPATAPANARQAEETRAEFDEQVSANEAFRSAGVPPDWLTTGLAGAGAGWIFGPIGALIGAAVTGIVSKRRNESILAAATADVETGNSLIEGGERSVARLEAAAETPQDKLEAQIVRDQFEQSRVLASSPNPQVAAAGFQSLMSIPGLVSSEADEIEAASLAREELERDQFSTEIGRADGIRDDIQREGGSFAIRQDAYERMLKVDDTAAGDQVLLVNAFKMVDPNSAVLPGEAATAANTAGIPDALVTAYNLALRQGQRLEPEQRADLIRQAGLQYGVARADQVDRNTDAIARGRAQDIRPALLNQIPFPVKSQDELPYPTGDTSEAANEALKGRIKFDPVSGVVETAAAANAGTSTAINDALDTLTGQPDPTAAVGSAESFSIFDTSPEAREARRAAREERGRDPGLFQPGGLFGERETN